MVAGYLPDIIGQELKGSVSLADHPRRPAVPALRPVRTRDGWNGCEAALKPVRHRAGQPAHWVLRIVGFVAIVYLALSPFFRDLKANEYGELVDIVILGARGDRR